MRRAPTLITVGPRAPALEAVGAFVDGRSGQPRRAALAIDEAEGALVIAPEGGSARRWPLDEVRRVPDQAGRDRLVLARDGDPVARLMTSEMSIVHRCPNLDRRRPMRSRRRVAAWAVAAVASVALIITVLVPLMADQLARYIPPAGERALGEATLGQIRSALAGAGVDPVGFCTEPEGRAALDRIEARLQASVEMRHELSVHVLDHGMVNAFALPGGFVVFFRGLLEAAESPEEVAAVFAHEIGHVKSRDPTRHALRSAGSIGVLGLLFGDFAGGAAVLFLAEQLIQASYSREAEAAADSYAHEALQAAELPPEALGTFFARLRDEGGEPPEIVTHFLSHPRMAERIAAAQDAGSGPVRPLLSADEWAALKSICGRRRPDF